MFWGHAPSYDLMDFAEQIKQSAAKKNIYTLHALDEMNTEDKIITTDEIRHVLLHGEIVENYPEDKREA
jgi:hypothetical protein